VFQRFLAKLSCGGVRNIKHQIMDSRDFGLPQMRRRLYVVGRLTCCVKTEEMCFVNKPAVPLAALLDRRCGGEGAGEDGHTARANLKRVTKMLQADGHDVNKVDAIIDLYHGRGDDAVNYQINMMPTITASRAANRAYYSTKRRRRLSVSELLRCQGFDKRVGMDKIKFAGLSDFSIGKMAGNAMSATVLQAVMLGALKSLK